MRRVTLLALLAFSLAATPVPRASLPRGFVYLADVAPAIVQDIRYAGAHNIVGHPLPGYLAPSCILTIEAARALANAQAELADAGLALRVYDCYQPRRAANALLQWSRDRGDQRMKAEYYPRVAKSELYAQGYLLAAPPSTRGSAVALSVERLGLAPAQPWVPGQHSCIAPFIQRYHDGSIDMGTNFGCMDPLSRTSQRLGAIADTHRAMLADLMAKYGFKPYGALWWNFVLAAEPFPKAAFDFPVTPAVAPPAPARP